MMEIWKEFKLVKTPYHEGIIYASNLGKIKTVDRVTSFFRNGAQWQAKVRGQILTQTIGKNGYLEVTVNAQSRRIRYYSHRVIASCFCDGYQEGLTVNHLNGIKTDNRPENLEWVSLARNTQHQWEIGLVNNRGDSHPNAKLTSKRVVYIRKLLNQGISPNTIAIVADISPTIIYRIRDGKQWNSVE